jgi:hypothetical protein
MRWEADEEIAEIGEGAPASVLLYWDRDDQPWHPTDAFSVFVR